MTRSALTNVLYGAAMGILLNVSNWIGVVVYH